MEGVELQQLLSDKGTGAESLLAYAVAISQRQHKTAQDEEERYTALSTKVEPMPNQMRKDNEHHEDKSQRMEGSKHFVYFLPTITPQEGY